MATIGDIQVTADRELQSFYRRLEPMAWHRGLAHFEDPNGRRVSLDRVNAQSFLAFDDDPELYLVPSGSAKATSLALELAAVSANPAQAPARALWFVRVWGLLRGTRREQWGTFLEASGALLHAFALVADMRSDGEQLGAYMDRIRSVLDRSDLSTSDFVAAIVTNGAYDCETQLISTGPGAFAVSARCRTLAGRAHYEAGLLLAAREPLRECQAGGCGRLFVVEDPRMLFCSPRCREREKKRRSRAATKEAQA